MKIALIRHGKTAGNERHAYIGKLDEELSDKGVKETILLKDYYDKLLGSYKSVKVFTSPMRRCKQTSGILFPNAQAVSVNDFAEMNFGIFEGKSFKDMENDEAYRSWVESECEDQIPDGDKKSDFSSRCCNAFYEVVNENADENSLIVIVCHGGTIMAIMEHIAGGKYYDYNVNNTAGYLIDIKGDINGNYKISYDRIGDGVPA